jgi:O-methyltransferase
MIQERCSVNLGRQDMSAEGLSPSAHSSSVQTESLRQLYLDLLKRALTRFAFPDRYVPIERHRKVPLRLASRLSQALLSPLRLELVRRVPFDRCTREEGLDWPAEAETMIGLRRLNNLETCVTDVIRRGVPGDLIETGVWRGGASIFMRAVLKAYGETQRTVWVADSFQGLPRPNLARYPADAGIDTWKNSRLAIPLEEVRENFRRYGLLDEQVRFLPGWFRDTLPSAPIERLSILRLDGDLYESTHDSLTNLYPKLSPGGYVIIDDYGIPCCKAAVEDYRALHKIPEPVQTIDRYGAFWRRA